MIFTLNKSELLSIDEVLDIVDLLELNGNKKWIDISAVTGKNMDKLERIIDDAFQNYMQQNSEVGVKTYGN